MTRTDHILEVLTRKVESMRVSIDTDDSLKQIILSLKMNDAGHPRFVEVDRKNTDDLTEQRAEERVRR